MTTANSQLLERIQALEDEVSLLKTEIRQVLIDMRDNWLKRSDVLSSAVVTSVPAPVACVLCARVHVWVRQCR